MAKIVVRLPGDWPKEKLEQINKSETARSMGFVKEGKLKHIFRIVGQRANFSIWEVESPDELHAALTSLPWHPYMDVTVWPIIKHTTTQAWGHPRRDAAVLPGSNAVIARGLVGRQRSLVSLAKSVGRRRRVGGEARQASGWADRRLALV